MFINSLKGNCFLFLLDLPRISFPISITFLIAIATNAGKFNVGIRRLLWRFLERRARRLHPGVSSWPQLSLWHSFILFKVWTWVKVSLLGTIFGNNFFFLLLNVLQYFLSWPWRWCTNWVFLLYFLIYETSWIDWIFWKQNFHQCFLIECFGWSIVLVDVLEWTFDGIIHSNSTKLSIQIILFTV